MAPRKGMQSYLRVAARAAREAGSMLLQEMGKNRRIRYKGDIDLVTDGDVKSQKLVVGHIRRECPDHGFIVEEVDRALEKRESRFRWIIDPLDGTTNFTHRYPLFSVSIALEVEGTLEIGVIYLPYLKELFTAVRGKGAFLNGKGIRVSRTTRIGRSLICTGFPYDIHERSRRILSEFNRVVRSARAVRRDGSAAIDLAFAACGRFDGFFERGLKIWDVAAGVVLIQEAGGMVTDYRGRPGLNPGEIVASNGKIHRQLVHLLHTGNSG